MKTAHIFSALGVVLVLCFISRSRANPTECQEAVSEYKSAREDIATALQAYANCFSGNDGHDDCSSEFGTLKSAQDDFEDAVSKYESECN
jgi:hypothetical protein